MRIAERVRRLAAHPFVFALVLSCTHAAAFAEVAVPPELRGWEDWALQGHESHRCPWLVPGPPTDEARVCAWPAVLELQVDERGGRFTQRWEAATDTWVPLPGSTENWPEEVTIDGSPAALVARGGGPAVRVAPGVHALAGVFRWTTRPEMLAVPENVALVNLSLAGNRVLNPQRTEAAILLGARAVARQDNHLDVRVFRRLDDRLPALLTTEVHLAVAGEAREIRLPAALPTGYQPTAIESSLTARLDPDNVLRVQVRPGDFTVTLRARGPSPVAEVRLGERPAPWPSEEVWSFAADDRLRVVAIEGLSALDPTQANVPQVWHDLPAYRMNSAAVLKVVERSRGLSAADGNDLRLQRTAWLDFAGTGYTIVDNVSGPMRQNWRLDLGEPYSLRSARVASGEPLLVTAGMTAGLTGVELRGSTLELTAISRLDRSAGAVPATGWRARFTGVAGRLVMAPGYRLLAVLGPDSAPQAWLERWSLLDIFVVLLTATVAWRALGIRTAAIALVASVLTYQESGAPTWLWLAVLVSLALQRAAPPGRLRAWAAGVRVLALVLLVLALLPFAITQARLAVYPQLEALIPGPYPLQGRIVGAPPVRMQVEGLEEDKAREGPRAFKRTEPAAPSTAISGSLSGAAVSGNAAEERVLTTGPRTLETEMPRYEPGAVVQAGPGVPAWSYHVYSFSWSGAVEQNATVHFLISPPWMTRLWRILGLLFAVLFVFELAPRELPSIAGWARERGAAALGGVALFGLVLACGALPVAHAATTPDPALIDQLRTELLAPPKCSPDCAAVLSADVTVSAARLSVVMAVTALDAVGIALPGADPNWTPDLVQLDGAGAGWVQRGAGGFRYVSLPRGRHVARIEGPLQAVDSLRLAFPVAPQVIDVHAADWEIGGVSDRRLMSGALELARKRVPAATPGAGGARQEEFPPFVEVDRLFHLSQVWTIDTTVTRVAPRSAAFTISLPLLAQEAVTTPGLQASGRSLAVALGAGENTRSFASILPRSDMLELIAASGNSHNERWRFEVGATWHADFSGIPAVRPDRPAATWIFEYYPRPGERLKIAVTRPTASAGGTLAFDSVALETVVGKRSSDSSLRLSYRSTQGGRQTLRIPAGAVVTQVLSDGQPLGLRPEHGELSLSALPGAHNWSVDWRSPNGVGIITRSPHVEQAAPASNLRVSLRVPDDRWVLFASGPGVGPTILYWGELLLFVIAAWWIGRSALTPLPARDWLLLGLGLSTFSWFALGLFAVFIALFQWRARQPAAATPERFKLLQLLSAFIAIVAIVSVVAAVPEGLLAHPDMRIKPRDGDGTLSWFMDQSAAQLPTPSVLSISLWWYKLAMLAWALWVSFALTRWTRWGWQVFTRDGLWPRAPGRPPLTSPATQPAETS